MNLLPKPTRSCLDDAAWEDYRDTSCKVCGTDDWRLVTYCSAYEQECYATCPEAAATYRRETPLWLRALNWLLLRGTARYYLRCEFVRERDRCAGCQKFE